MMMVMMIVETVRGSVTSSHHPLLYYFGRNSLQIVRLTDLRHQLNED